MSDLVSPAKLRAGEVLAHAAAEGFDVTPEQLARWHRAGLLPRPTQRALGRGRGTVAEYEASAAEQLVALCDIRTKSRSLSRAGFQLWWHGYEVDERLYREPIERAAATLLAEITGERAVTTTRAAKGGRGLFSTDLQEEILSDLRKAVAAPSVSSTDWTLPVPTELPTIDELGKLISDALGRALTGVDVVADARQASAVDLATARDRAKSMLAMISTWAPLLGWLVGRPGAVFNSAARMVEQIQPADLPGLVIAQLIVQRVIPPEFFDLIADPTQLPEILQDLRAVDLLRRFIPGASEVLTPAAVRAVHRGKEAARRHEERIQAFVAEHETEVRAILDSR